MVAFAYVEDHCEGLDIDLGGYVCWDRVHVVEASARPESVLGEPADQFGNDIARCAVDEGGRTEVMIGAALIDDHHRIAVLDHGEGNKRGRVDAQGRADDDCRVGPFRHVPRSVRRLGWKLLAEVHNLGLEDPAAAETPRIGRAGFPAPFDLVEAGFVTTGDAVDAMGIPVEFDERWGTEARGGVESIDEPPRVQWRLGCVCPAGSAGRV